MTRGATVYYLHNDHLGRPELATNASRVAVWRANNDTFGNREVTLDSLGGLNVGFPGQYADAESGLWNNFNRCYESSHGRYWQADPIGLAGGVNPYVYVGGNPVNDIDPFGLARYSPYFSGPLQEGDCYGPDPDTKLERVFPEGYVLGAARLAYAGLAKSIPAIAGAVGGGSAVGEAAFANANRNSLKDLFRLPFTPILSGWRQPSFVALYAKYGGNVSKIVSGSATTSAAYNAGGAAAIAAAAAKGSAGSAASGSAHNCGCRD